MGAFQQPVNIIGLVLMGIAGTLMWLNPHTYPLIERLNREIAVVAFDPDFTTLIDVTHAEVKPLAHTLSRGHVWVEGPVWRPAGDSEASQSGTMLFSDPRENKVYEWDPVSRKSEVLLFPSGLEDRGDRKEPGANGLALEPSTGKLVMCDQGNRAIVRIEADGSRTVLAAFYRGSKFNSPNDLVFAKNGDLYFTDPSYGLLNVRGPRNGEDSLERELNYNGVYLVKNTAAIAPNDDDTDGERATLLLSSMSRPNGIGLSPDNQFLYISNSNKTDMHWRKYIVREDGSLGPGRVFARIATVLESHLAIGEGILPTVGNVDGLDVDDEGNLWVTVPGGVAVLTPDGRHLGTIGTGVKTGNVALTEKWVYIAADRNLLRVERAAYTRKRIEASEGAGKSKAEL